MKLRQMSSRIDWSILTILALPWLQLLIYRGWIYTASHLIDPWVYLGYMLQPAQYLKVFAGTYYGTRLSWILPGHFLYELLPPIVANYVLHLGVYYLAAISLYLILKLHFGWRTGLVTAIAMGCYPYFIMAVGWDYVDGVGIAYCLLTMLMLTYASTSRYWKLAFLLSGCSCGALLISNITWVFCIPSLVVYFLCSNQFYQKRGLITSFQFIITGFITVVIFFGLINYFINRDFLFYLPSINFALSSAGKPNPFTQDWSNWLPQATWLLLPVFAFISSILLVWLNRIKKIILSALVIGFQLCFILFFSIQVILELKGTIFLQSYFYASYSIPFLFLAIGSQLASVLERLRKLEVGLALSLCIIISATFLLVDPVDETLIPYYPDLALAYCCLYFFVGVCSLLLAQFRTPRKVAVIAGLVLVLILTTPVLETAMLASDLGRRNQQEEDYLATMDASKILQSIDPEIKLVFWYDGNEAHVYRSIASTYLWGYRLISEEFPSLSTPYLSIDQVQKQLQQHPKVVILSKQTYPFSQTAKQSLSKAGFQAKPLASYPINRGQRSFTMTVIEVSKI